MLQTSGLSISLDFSSFDYPVHFVEKSISKSPLQYSTKLNMQLSSFDPELLDLDVNPIDQKVRTLTRSTRYGPLDEELKPTAKTRDELKVRPQSKSEREKEKRLLLVGHTLCYAR